MCSLLFSHRSPPLLLLLSVATLLLPQARAEIHTNVKSVIHIVIDGLRSDFLKGQPAFDYLLETGACTLNARIDRDSSQTLPNHMSMFTNLPVRQHGYEKDVDNGGRVKLESTFDIVKGKTALYTEKDKFDVFRRSFDMSNYYFNRKNVLLQKRFLSDFPVEQYAYSYLHIRDPDYKGHKNGSLGAQSEEYKEGVSEAAAHLGKIFHLISTHPDLRGNTALVVTSDHGFSNFGNHGNQNDPNVYSVPLCAWGPGAEAGGELYEINKKAKDSVQDPGKNKVGHERMVLNAYSGALAVDWLGIHPTSGPFADQYLMISSDEKKKSNTVSWTEWVQKNKNRYDWSTQDDLLLETLSGPAKVRTMKPTRKPTPLPPTVPDGGIVYSFPEGEGPNRLRRCRGDCDSDDDCRSGLICYMRNGKSSTEVPGCEGEAIGSDDYCINPKDLPPTPSPTSAPTTASPTKSPTAPKPTKAPTKRRKNTSSPSKAPTESILTGKSAASMNGEETSGDKTEGQKWKENGGANDETKQSSNNLRSASPTSSPAFTATVDQGMLPGNKKAVSKESNSGGGGGSSMPVIVLTIVMIVALIGFGIAAYFFVTSRRKQLNKITKYGYGYDGVDKNHGAMTSSDASASSIPTGFDSDRSSTSNSSISSGKKNTDQPSTTDSSSSGGSGDRSSTSGTSSSCSVASASDDFMENERTDQI